MVPLLHQQHVVYNPTPPQFLPIGLRIVFEVLFEHFLPTLVEGDLAFDVLLDLHHFCAEISEVGCYSVAPEHLTEEGDDRVDFCE